MRPLAYMCCSSLHLPTSDYVSGHVGLFITSRHTLREWCNHAMAWQWANQYMTSCKLGMAARPNRYSSTLSAIDSHVSIITPFFCGVHLFTLTLVSVYVLSHTRYHLLTHTPTSIPNVFFNKRFFCVAFTTFLHSTSFLS